MSKINAENNSTLVHVGARLYALASFTIFWAAAHTERGRSFKSHDERWHSPRCEMATAQVNI
jgi:hypothetical protein